MGVKSVKDLDVYKRCYKFAMRIFEVTKAFPTDERYSFLLKSPSSAEESSDEPLQAQAADSATINPLSLDP